MTPIEKLLPRLEKVQDKGSGRYMACCPAHDDRSPSLSIKECDDSRLLIHCFAGCPTDDVVAAVGLTMADLFPYDSRQGGANSPCLSHKLRRELRDDAEHERAVLLIMGADVGNGRMIDSERAVKAKERLREIGGLLNEQ